MLHQVMAMFGVEKLALGSDYPFPLGEDHPGAMIEAMEKLTEHERGRMLGGTALEFLGLQENSFSGASGGGGR